MIKFTACLALALLSSVAAGQVTNLKVVTDASPDYSDMPSLIHSITSRWDNDKEKMWALFYCNHIARRQTSPMWLRGYEALDPIRQFNDYGFTQCSTISGISAGIWDFMGYESRYYEIGRHTVCEVFYDGGWHLYDSSLSAMYTLCDGKTIAGVRDIGAEGACEASGGQSEMGHIARYHCLNGTSPNGYLEGADCARTLESEAISFHPNNIKHQYFYKDADYGHRYILNIRPGETYTRTYGKLGETPAFFVPREGSTKDLELANPRYRIRGNGQRTWQPPLTAAALPAVAHSMKNVRALESGGVEGTDGGGEIIFKVQGGNVMASMEIEAHLDLDASISISSTNGMEWKEMDPAVPNAALAPQTPDANVHTPSQARIGGVKQVRLSLREEVSGEYDVLVRVSLPPQAHLFSIQFDTTTQLNSKTQPRLNIGRNTVYVGAGASAESIVLWPDLREGRTKPFLVESQNVASLAKPDFHYATMHLEDAAVPKGFAVFKVDAPTDITSITYGGRFCTRAPESKITLLHSFDGGETWQQSWQLSDNTPPWDVVHHETIRDIPPGTRSVLFKYHLFSYESSPALCGLYNVRMEVNHAVADPGFKPMEVTFNWSERQEDYSLVQRSHTQLVEKVPFTYTLNVGGADHPVVNSLRINAKGAAGDLAYGYSDGRDAGGDKWTGTWATYGRNLARGKSYTTSIPSATNWDAGDPDGKKLTDGVVGSSYTGGAAYREGALWPEGKKPEIVIDLGQAQPCAAFRIHLLGYPGTDAIEGEMTDQVELLTSIDGTNFTSQGHFDLNLRWKDIPANYMWTDEETFRAHNFLLTPKVPIEARYVKYRLTPSRMLGVTELQVLDSVKIEPFDLKLALPEDAPAVQ